MGNLDLAQDDAVSHHHAKLARQPDGTLSLADAGSTNGTYLNGVAPRTADICRCHRDQFVDRGAGLLALIYLADRALEALLVNQVIPMFSRFLASYNASLPPQRQLRVRVVVHQGEVRYDANGYFRKALDVAFRRLDAPRVKMALKTAPGPLLLVVSGDIHRSVVRHDLNGTGTGQAAFHRLVSADIAGKQYPRWIHIPHNPPNTTWPATSERHSW